MLNKFKQIFEGLDYAYGNFIREVNNLPTHKQKVKLLLLKNLSLTNYGKNISME